MKHFFSVTPNVSILNVGWLIISLFLFSPFIATPQDKGRSSGNLASEDLLEQYIRSRGNNCIVFDQNNIKQFWIDKSVLARDDFFSVMSQDNTLHFESIPLKIQLANVTEQQDCEVEVITDTPDVSFSILNSDNKTIARSSPGNDFVRFHTVSSLFHMEDFEDISFYIVFSSPVPEIKLRKIILSFKDNTNSSFLSSPGELKITSENISAGVARRITSGSATIQPIDDTTFSAESVYISLFLKKQIYVNNNIIKNSVTIKNIGDNDTSVYVGYVPYTKHHERIDNRSIPYKNNKCVTVVNAEAGSDKITVDSSFEWTKGCFIALNAKDDLSDFPNCSYLEGRIVDVIDKEPNIIEIHLDKPLKDEIKPGSRIRIQSPHAATYLYTNSKTLKPGEEIEFTSEIQKDDDFYGYSSKKLCRGVYYVIPTIISNSMDSSKKNTILIKDFKVSY